MSTGRVSARSSSCGNAGSEASACPSLGPCRKDLTGVRSRYTRSSSLSLLASTAGAVSSAGSTYRKKSGGVYCLIPLAVGDLVSGLLFPPMLEFLGSPFPSEGTLCGVPGGMAESRGRRPRMQHSVKKKVSRSFWGGGRIEGGEAANCSASFQNQDPAAGMLSPPQLPTWALKANGVTAPTLHQPPSTLSPSTDQSE